MDVAKMKVVELRAELAARGLDQKGNKPVLIARLQEALDADLDDKKSDDDVPLASKVDDPGDDSEPAPDKSPAAEETSEPAPDKSPAAEETSSQSGDQEASQQGNESADASFQDESESKEVNENSVEDFGPVACPEFAQANSAQSIEAVADEESLGESRDVDDEISETPVDEASVQSGYDSEQASIPQETAAEGPDAALGQDSNSQPEPMEQKDTDNKDDPAFDLNSSSQSKEPESMDGWQQPDFADTAPDRSFHIDDSNAQDAVDAEQHLRASDATEDADKPADDADASEAKPIEMAEGGEGEPADLPAPDNKMETEEEPAEKQKEEENGEVKKEEEESRRERKRNRWADADPTPSSDNSQDFGRNYVLEEAPWRKREVSPQKTKPENEPYYDEKEVILSWYDSDLQLIIDKDNFYSASLNNHEGFGYVWAGVRATYGYGKGKVFFQVKISNELILSQTLEGEPTPHALRVGWSILGGLQLGEEPFSYGYGSTGKISTNCEFADYGKPFAKGDIITCYADLDANPIVISYSVNGESQGTAYEVDPETLKGQPLFPHVLSKNCAFHVNFGENEPWTTAEEGFTFVGRVPIEDRVLGPVKPASRAECEVIMLVGLPGAGKTTWAQKFASENKDKAYNILGTNTLLDKMKVSGVPRRRNYHGRWDVLIAKCTRCLNTLLELATTRRRNYIIDQTNVYPSAQKRKMKGFEGYKKKAVVIVPTDELLKERIAKREAEEGKDVPDSAVLEMKANFALPDKDDFEVIEWVELQEAEAAELVKQYNQEGNAAGYETRPPQQKRARFEEREESDRSGGGRDERRGNGGFNRGQEHRGGRHNDRFNDRRQGGFGGGGGGGFRDRNNGGGNRGGGGGGWRDRGNDRRGDRDNWGGGSGGGGRGGWRDNKGGGGGGGSGGWGKDNRGGRGRDGDRGGDRDKRNSGGNWNSQQQGYNQNWSGSGGAGGGGGQQGFGNQQQWGNWQGYNQNNQWKNYQQGWNQQGWGNQAQWANWNQQQYYNQGWGQQGWGQQQAGATPASTDTAAVAQQAYNYAQTGAAAQGGAVNPWANYYGGAGGTNSAQQPQPK